MPSAQDLLDLDIALTRNKANVRAHTDVIEEFISTQWIKPEPGLMPLSE